MLALWIALVGGLLLAMNLAVSVPQEEEKLIKLTADVAATNLYAYRTSVINYYNVNPTATGTIADGSLTYLPGYIRDTTQWPWTNLIQGGTLFVYSTTSSVSLDSVNAIYTKGGKSMLVGKKAASGNLVSATGIDTNITLPSAIATGAITIVGR